MSWSTRAASRCAPEDGDAPRSAEMRRERDDASSMPRTSTGPSGPGGSSSTPAPFYGADVLVMGGDVMGKLTIPIIREADGRYRATIHGRVEHLETEAEVEAATATDRRSSGFYDTVMDEDEYAATQGDPAGGRSALRRARRPSASSAGSTWPRSKLAGTGIRCYATGGNDDVTEVMARHGPSRHAAVRRLRGPGRPARRPPHHGQHAVRQPDAVAHAAGGDGGRARGADRPRSPAICPTTTTRSSTSTCRPRTRRSTRARSSTGRRTRRRRSCRAASRPVRRRQHGGPRRDRALPADARASTGTSTNRRRRPSSAGRCASTRAASTARASCAAASSRSTDGQVKGYQMTAG